MLNRCLNLRHALTLPHADDAIFNSPYLYALDCVGGRHMVLEPRRSAENGLRAGKWNDVQGVSMRFSSELNGPCSNERGFIKDVFGSHFSDEMMYLIYLTVLHDYPSQTL
jgi:hypothetical protein